MNTEIENRIKANYDLLSQNEKKIAQYLRESDSSVCYLSIQEMANEIETSPSAITRFVKKIGYNTYQEMRLQLADAQEHIEEPFFPTIQEDDSVLNIAKATFQCGINSLQSTLAILNENSLERALDLLKRANICGVFGLGASKIMGEAFCQRFLRTSLKTRFFEDYHMQLMMAGTLGSSDCALVLSHSGRNKDMLRIVDVLREHHVPIIVITSNPSSPITRKSDVFLFCISEETKYRPEAISSSISHLLLIDTLFTLYAVKVDDDPTFFSNIRKIVNTTRQ